MMEKFQCCQNLFEKLLFNAFVIFLMSWVDLLKVYAMVGQFGFLIFIVLNYAIINILVH